MANLRRKAPKGMKTMREYKAGLKRDDNIMQAKMKRISPKPKRAPLPKPPQIIKKKTKVKPRTPSDMKLGDRVIRSKRK